MLPALLVVPFDSNINTKHATGYYQGQILLPCLQCGALKFNILRVRHVNLVIPIQAPNILQNRKHWSVACGNYDWDNPPSEEGTCHLCREKVPKELSQSHIAAKHAKQVSVKIQTLNHV